MENLEDFFFVHRNNNIKSASLEFSFQDIPDRYLVLTQIRRHFDKNIKIPVVQGTNLDYKGVICAAAEPCHALYHAIKYKGV